MLVLARQLEYATDNESYFKNALSRRMSCFLLFPLPLTASTDNPRERHKHWSPTVLNFLKGLNQAFKMGCINAVSDYLHLQCETRAILSKQTHRNHRSDWCYHLKHVLYFSLGLKNTWEKSVCKNSLYKIRVPNGLKICLETRWSKGKYNDSFCMPVFSCGEKACHTKYSRVPLTLRECAWVSFFPEMKGVRFSHS